MNDGTKFDVDVIAAGESRILRYPEGAVIFREDDPAECAYIIKRGRIDIVELDRQIETMEPGEIFGEMALIDEERRTAGAVAAGPVELIPIDRPMFEVLIRDDSDFALTIMRLMVRRLRATLHLLHEDAATRDSPVQALA